MSQMTCRGSKPEASATKSASASRWLVIMLVTIVRARSRTLSSMRATTFGVNARLTIVRSRR